MILTDMSSYADALREAGVWVNWVNKQLVVSVLGKSRLVKYDTVIPLNECIAPLSRSLF